MIDTDASQVPRRFVGPAREGAVPRNQCLGFRAEEVRAVGGAGILIETAVDQIEGAVAVFEEDGAAVGDHFGVISAESAADDFVDGPGDDKDGRSSRNLGFVARKGTVPDVCGCGTADVDARAGLVIGRGGGLVVGEGASGDPVLSRQQAKCAACTVMGCAGEGDAFYGKVDVGLVSRRQDTTFFSA